jgi:hypothetical protein
MNIKKTINFKELKDNGPASIKLKNDEILKLVSPGLETHYIITQEHLFKLFTNEEKMLELNGNPQKTTPYNPKKLIKEIKKKMKGPLPLLKEDYKEFNIPFKK